jgi:hypothetical protein
MSVTVGASNVTGLTLRLRPNATVRGRVVLDQDPVKPAAQAPRVFVTLDSANGQPSLGLPAAAVLNTNEFEIPNVQPGTYWLRAQTGDSNWVIKSVQWNGRDYTRVPIDMSATDDLAGLVVTLTNAVPTLIGVVRTAEGPPPASGVVVVFPVLAAERTATGLLPTRMRSIPLAAGGGYTFSNLPAGDYLIAAIGQARMSTWRDPDVLAIIERQAVRVTLRLGQTTNQDLTMVGK